MTDPGWALQKAVYARLTSDAAVMAALGGAKVYDHVPRRTPKPYVTFGRNVVRDFSTSDAEAHEHDLALHVWAGAKGRKETAAILDAVRSSLHDGALALDGHRLINLRHTASEITREDDGETLEGIARFRAVTEVA
jgi:hypothetical protein